MLKTGNGSGCHFVRSICNDVTGKYDIPLTLWNLASSVFRTPCAMCHLLLYSWIVFSAGGSSDRLPFLLNQSPMSASLWLALTWNWKFCNNCRKLLILKNCRIPHYGILLLPTTLECNGTNQSDNCWLTNSEQILLSHFENIFPKNVCGNKLESPFLHPLTFQMPEH